ncbi:MAG TPA: branched-chain amino acid ABC transporter permease [Solirubrobacteraceae bacterium]|jgi:branched-chain amino acid transport system permease protein|nr:branched-chain amino acid ABC transporter permease [Solirubrobacteraceae bacterium]
MTARAVGVVRGSTLLRSLAIVVIAGLVLILVTDSVSAYRNLQIAYGAYYFCVLAGLTVLAGASGQISLGQGAFMAVGAYTFSKLNATPVAWSVLPSLVGAVVAAVLIGIPVGVAASRLRGPYLAGATLAFAVGLPALADKFQTFLGGENGLVVNPPTPPSWLGANFSLERWEAWIGCAGALVVVFVLYNLIHSAVGRSWRAVRDDEIAASLAGLRVGRRQALAFTISAGCAGLGGGLLAAVTQLASPGAFPLQLSLTLLAGVVIGGLGSLVGAVWGAALLVLLPNWTNDLANSFSLSGNVSHNLPIAIYGLVLIGAMLVWPSGIQGGVRAIAHGVGPAIRSRRGPPGSATPSTDATEAAQDEEVKTSQP